MHRLYLALLSLSLTWSVGCATNIYELPPPPEKGERSQATLAVESKDADDQVDEQAARSALVKVYNLLSTQRYEEAVDLMSQETRAFITHNSESSASDVLESGTLNLPGGRVVQFEPSTFFVASDVQSIEADSPGTQETETDRRRVFSVVSEDGASRPVVMIKQGGQWVLHQTRPPESSRGME